MNKRKVKGDSSRTLIVTSRFNGLKFCFVNTRVKPLMQVAPSDAYLLQDINKRRGDINDMGHERKEGGTKTHKWIINGIHNLIQPDNLVDMELRVQ